MSGTGTRRSLALRPKAALTAPFREPSLPFVKAARVTLEGEAR